MIPMCSLKHYIPTFLLVNSGFILFKLFYNIHVSYTVCLFIFWYNINITHYTYIYHIYYNSGENTFYIQFGRINIDFRLLSFCALKRRNVGKMKVVCHIIYACHSFRCSYCFYLHWIKSDVCHRSVRGTRETINPKNECAQSYIPAVRVGNTIWRLGTDMTAGTRWIAFVF